MLVLPCLPLATIPVAVLLDGRHSVPYQPSRVLKQVVWELHALRCKRYLTWHETFVRSLAAARALGLHEEMTSLTIPAAFLDRLKDPLKIQLRRIL